MGRARGFIARNRSWRRAGMAVALTVMAAVLPWPSGPAHAVHDVGLFELDGNAQDSADPGADWNDLGTPLASRFIDDGTDELTNPPLDTSFFTTGGSKDINDVPDWRHTANGGTDKVDITNAYAAAYKGLGLDTDLYLYFGLDRFDNSGDANAGFWFFQNPISVGPNGKFIGEHEEGDIFIASTFTNGGMISTIKAFAWDTDATNNLLELSLPGVTCGTASDDDLCAISNTSATPAPWQYTPKMGPAGTFPTAALLEGGINLSAIFGAEVPCFSSFMAESRSSSSETAVLKDFALGAFEFCGLSVQKTGTTLSKVGDIVDYTITITNTGMGTLYKDLIDDSFFVDPLTENGIDDPDAPVTSNCVASLPAGQSCTITYQRTVLLSDLPGPLENTVTVNYNSSPELNGVGVEFEVSDDHDVELFQPAVEVTKTGDALSTVGDPVDYVITVTNTSSGNSPDLVNGSIEDTLLGNLLDANNPFVTGSTCTATLAPGASCTINATRTVLEGDDDPLPNTVTVHYNPDGFLNDIRAQDDHSVNLFQPSVLVEKSGPAQSKVGDTVTYNIKVTNTSSDDTPTLLLDSISDPLIGELTIPAECNALDPGEFCEFTADRVVQAGDPNPLVNIVTVVFHADGFTVDVAGTSDSDSHSTDLFVPSVSVSKGGPAEAQVGDTVTYTFTVTNTSTANSPALILDSIEDPLIGALTIPAACNILDAGESCNFTADRDVLAGDPDPLVNTVTVHYHPTGFPNDVADTDGHTVDIVSPYNQYPGDDDFDFDTPFDDAGDPGTPAPTTDTAGINNQTGTQQPAAPAPQPAIGNNVVENNVAVAQPDPAAPVALDQLPRTGQGLDRVTMFGGLMLIVGGLTVMVGRRRKAHKA
jgi:hypothetical protein